MVQLQKQLKAAEKKITQYKSKDNRVQELKREINQLRANKDASERAHERYA